MVQRRREEERDRQREGWVDLGCLPTPGLSKDIWCHDHTVLNYMVQRVEREREVGGFGLFDDTWSQ